ncbi:unnamed protein product [Brassica oleracea]
MKSLMRVFLLSQVLLQRSARVSPLLFPLSSLDATSALKTPITLLGRMSFQSFNPSSELSVIELFFLLKLNEEAISVKMPSSFSEPKIEPSRKTNGDLKRKHAEGVSEEQNHPSNSPRSSDTPLPSNKKGRDGFKKTKSRKEAWSVLKPPKPQTNKIVPSTCLYPFDKLIAKSFELPT